MRTLLKTIIVSFWQPLAILIGIGIYPLLLHQGLARIAWYELLILILFGSHELFLEIIHSLRHKKFALDYIAVCAIVVALITDQMLVGAVIALMLATGQHLEKFAAAQAKKSLTSLIDRIPDTVTVMIDGASRKKRIMEVAIGEEILVRKGEVIPLDGMLTSDMAITDESSLTGEPYMFEKFAGDVMRSGTINMGNPIVIRVTKTEEDSTYKKIVDMVKSAQEEKAPLIRLADKYSTIFTVITFVICAAAYLATGDLTRILAVLVVATPCPLILATPIALLGGVSACAKRRIIAKRLSSLEVLARITAIIFDKTGTITMGKPQVAELHVHDANLSKKEMLAIAAGIERNSLHPLAKAIVEEALSHKVHIRHATDVHEMIGQGIQGMIDETIYSLKRGADEEIMSIEFFRHETNERAHEHTNARTPKKTHIATFIFEDTIKKDTVETLAALRQFNLETHMFTGNKRLAAEKVATQLGIDIRIRAECTPQDKLEGIKELKTSGKVTAMIGDGINDAPALALADIGIVFSNEEQTASSEAADMVFLGGDFNLVLTSIRIAKRTIHIALQSILWGIGLSIAAMLLAAFGLIIPLIGAIIQELIDVTVIINALRAAKYHE